MSQQQASVSQGQICSDNLTCCHTETEVADPTFHLTQSQYTDTGPASPSADPITPGRVVTVATAAAVMVLAEEQGEVRERERYRQTESQSQSSMCCIRLHTSVPGPLELMCWKAVRRL